MTRAEIRQHRLATLPDMHIEPGIQFLNIKKLDSRFYMHLRQSGYAVLAYFCLSHMITSL